MEKKENQRVVLTKRLLKESLLQLMSQKSIQKISVSELCNSSGINRSTFYNHYGSPYDVLKEMELDVIADLNRIYEKEKHRRSWPINKRVEALCNYLQEHRTLSKMLFFNSDTNSEFATVLFNATHVREIYEKTVADIKDPYSKQLMFTFLINGQYQMIRQWLLEDLPKSPKEMGEIAQEIAAHKWLQV